MNNRTSGLIKLLGGGIVFALVIQYFTRKGLNNDTLPGGPLAIIGICAPGGFALAGLIEVVSGIPFTQLSSSWDSLAGWQRGVLGLLIVAAAFALIGVGVVLFA